LTMGLRSDVQGAATLFSMPVNVYNAWRSK
jgi:hypothetical protein